MQGDPGLLHPIHGDSFTERSTPYRHNAQVYAGMDVGMGGSVRGCGCGEVSRTHV